jgi:hypothetical protein
LLGEQRYRDYTRGFLGLPLYHEVRAGQVTDIRDWPVRLTADDAPR